MIKKVKITTDLDIKIDNEWAKQVKCLHEKGASIDEMTALKAAGESIKLIFEKSALSLGEYKVKIVEDSYDDKFLYVVWVDRGSIKDRFFAVSNNTI